MLPSGLRPAPETTTRGGSGTSFMVLRTGPKRAAWQKKTSRNVDGHQQAAFAVDGRVRVFAASD
jgi:hypothetical protein